MSAKELLGRWIRLIDPTQFQMAMQPTSGSRRIALGEAFALDVAVDETTA